MYDGPVIDAHTHPMLYPEGQVGGRPHPPEDYRRRVAGLPVTRAAALVIAPRGDPAQTRRRNDATLRLARDSQDFFFPVCSVHPSDGADALAEIERVAAAGCQWLKLHPNNQHFDVADPAVTDVVRRATAAGLPVLFDAYSPWDADQPGKFVTLARAVPEARLILAHAHGPSFPQLVVYDFMARYPWWPRRVWVDISATVSLLAGSPFAEQFAWVLRKIGLDRVVYGSDYPLDDPVEAIAAVRSLGFSDAELAAVLYDNAAALLGSAGPGGPTALSRAPT
jgi:uncharacterized protein